MYLILQNRSAYKHFTQRVIQVAVDLGGTWYLWYYSSFTKKELMKGYPF